MTNSLGDVAIGATRNFLIALIAYVTISALIPVDAAEAPSPLFQQRLEEMAQQFDGKIGADTRDRSRIDGQQAFFFPSEAVSACAGSACVASGCGASACAGSACTGSACGGSGCGGSACGGSACGGSACGASVCGGSACAGSACGASGCIGSACGQSGCVGSACRQSGCVGSACNNCTGMNQTIPGPAFAGLGDSPVVQASCPFSREAGPATVHIAGFEVSQNAGVTEIRWIVTGGPVTDYRVFRQTDTGRVLVATGRAMAQRLHKVTDQGGGIGTDYILEVMDAAGWTTSAASGGDTARRPSLQQADANPSGIPLL